MLPEGLTVAIDLYKNSEATVGSLWGLYSGASLALLGYILGSKNPVPGRAKLGLGAIFLVFAISNARSLWQAQRIGYAARFSIQDFCQHAHLDTTPSVVALLSQLEMSRPQLVVGFQLVLTVVALAAIYAAHRHDTYVMTHSVLAAEAPDSGVAHK